MEAYKMFAFVVLLATTLYQAYATDPTQLQDFCVGVNKPNDGLFVNGLFCKDPMEVNPDDFLFRGLNMPANTDNALGFAATLVTAANLPGLNTLGISVARLDFAPHGLNPPHTHPRATEVFVVLEGTFYVGFVTSNLADGGNKLFAKVLNKGDVFVFPQGLIHFQLNIGNYPGVGISGLSSQNPGVITIANAVFGPEHLSQLMFLLRPSISMRIWSSFFRIGSQVVAATTSMCS
uniref:Germin-like protein n=1 Tax=Mesembryanthemum crystallinum TaxID=3544 RepID=GLP1_MESCR|nr:RecName: Full=Germin-like protein; Flags: Precursor [Mesembryanthemum crystallinum]AAA33030.1 germin-like protein [Mesembryanthemum crystallinum]prf//1909344A germin-like protein [Mesembryanthemum crystallinum]